MAIQYKEVKEDLGFSERSLTSFAQRAAADDDTVTRFLSSNWDALIIAPGTIWEVTEKKEKDV